MGRLLLLLAVGLTYHLIARNEDIYLLVFTSRNAVVLTCWCCCALEVMYREPWVVDCFPGVKAGPAGECLSILVKILATLTVFEQQHRIVRRGLGGRRVKLV